MIELPQERFTVLPEASLACNPPHQETSAGFIPPVADIWTPCGFGKSTKDRVWSPLLIIVPVVGIGAPLSLKPFDGFVGSVSKMSGIPSPSASTTGGIDVQRPEFVGENGTFFAISQPKETSWHFQSGFIFV